ncbi:uncharacterized protein (DUF1778 family) [Methylobacterium brachiatum]|jgi:uncharacterized protein (DUF1778 family)|uniref:Uncharacterized protein (DUF1778 family) n=1 Tax=Methylobacterium brachiatum TaxID=269660 RepID=A0AAJ1TPH1_9HYPH|nr:DUF1778 domain-containing protein [Methylobacterium brachiatum]MCB4801218.1 DUF1778 domain-containing protein [Methylobacterium brachiatum]MDQ0544580.1 uncharacterized protein (DUF1778 family) [Methylobacterium brachiatum]
MRNARRSDDIPKNRRRTDRLEARVTAEQKALVAHAAALEGRSITDFVLTSVQDAAKRAIAEHEVIQLSVRDSRAFVEALLAPREPSERMRDRVATYRTLMGGSET